MGLTTRMILFRVRLDKNFLNSPSLVVRMNEKYSSFSTAAPVLVSLLMSKVRTLQSGSVLLILVQSGSVWFSLVQSGSIWFSLGHSGSVWFSLIQSGSVWVSLVQSGSVWFSRVQSSSVWFSLVQSDSVWFSLILGHFNLCLCHLWGPDW